MNKIELLVAFAILAVALSNITSSQQKTLYNVQVDEVVDGDTIEVSGEIDATVRLLGVDTPEVSSTNNPEEYGMQDTVQRRDCLSRYGDRATEYVAERINNTEVNLKVDPSADRRGDYGRLLAYVQTENTSINKMLLEDGLARLYKSEFSKLEKYRTIQTQSKERQRGIWSCQ